MPLGVEGISKVGTLARLYNRTVDSVADKLAPAQFIKNPIKQATSIADEKLPATQKLDILKGKGRGNSAHHF